LSLVETDGQTTSVAISHSA